MLTCSVLIGCIAGHVIFAGSYLLFLFSSLCDMAGDVHHQFCNTWCRCISLYDVYLCGVDVCQCGCISLYDVYLCGVDVYHYMMYICVVWMYIII